MDSLWEYYNVNCFGDFVYILTVIRSEASLHLCERSGEEIRCTYTSLTAEAFCLLFLPFSTVIANTFTAAL